LGSIRSPKSQFDSEERKILDWEVAEPQEGATSGGIIAQMFFYFYSREQIKDIL
jgi:hypothetical protein